MKRRQTKTVITFFLACLCTTFISAQEYMITFSGSGQSATVETIEVKNIAQQTTLTLSGTDTLLLTDVVGTGHLPSLQKGLNIYPNPANHASRLEFFNSSAGNTHIEIYDFSGRLLVSRSHQLAAGSHAFTISGLHAGIYLVKVNTPEHIYSRRLISTSSQLIAPELQYEGRNQSRQQEPDFKSISNVVAMQYNDGERLVIKAISGDYAHTKSLIPTQSQNIDFEFIDCIDGDGNQYGVVTIGEQVWMTENLKTTTYKNGTPIPNVTNPDEWEYLTTGAYVWYDNDISWKDSYGALYNWFTTVDPNGLCPSGWHVPTADEWTALTDYIGGINFPHGNELKSCRQVNSPLGGGCNTSEHPRWDEDSESGNYGTDDYGFSGLPGGIRTSNGSFHYVGYWGHWWSTTESSSLIAWSRYLACHGNTVGVHYGSKHYSFSVRCLRD